MTIYDVIIKGRIELIARSPASGTNRPPVWDQQPNPVFVNGTADTYDIGALGSDPDDDALTYSLNTGAVSLPTGVTWDAGTGILTYDGAGAVDTTSGHVATLDDGTDSTPSNTFNISILSVVAAVGFPRIFYHHIGGRTESDRWRDTAYHDLLAPANDITFNFAVADQGHAAQAVSDIKAINPNVRVHNYRNFIGLLQASSTDLARQAYLEANFNLTGTGSGTDKDGMSRTVADAYISGWPDKNDVNPTNFIPTYLGQLPCEYVIMQEYDEWYTGTFATTFDDMYIDVWRAYPRDVDLKADWNANGIRADGTALGKYEGFDLTAPINTAFIAGKKAMWDAIQTAATSDRGESLDVLGETAWFDWWDGARADNDVIMPGDIPADMLTATQGGNLTNWTRKLGLNPDGTTRASGNFERAYKSAWRQQNEITTSTKTGTKRVAAHIEMQSGLWDETAYACGVATLAGCYCEPFHNDSRRDPIHLDEFYAGDASTLSTAQKVAAINWMGLPVGGPPEYGQIYSEGVEGGILGSTGVYALKFTDTGLDSGTNTALLIVNPEGNGTQTVSLPTGTWDYFTGAQRAINSGLQDVTEISNMGDGLAIFMKAG